MAWTASPGSVSRAVFTLLPQGRQLGQELHQTLLLGWLTVIGRGKGHQGGLGFADGMQEGTGSRPTRRWVSGSLISSRTASCSNSRSQGVDGNFTLQVERPTGAVTFTVGGATAPATFDWRMGKIQRGFRLNGASELVGIVSTEHLSLALGKRLVVVLTFDNASKTWSFWDGKEGSNLMEMSPGIPY